jgi:hypothetical protein
MVQTKGKCKSADVPQCRITEGAAVMRTRSFALDAAALLLVVVIVLITLVLIGHVGAEPLPYPKQPVQQCVGSYMQSGGFYVPKSGGTVREAIPKPRGVQCPSGWASSGGA